MDKIFSFLETGQSIEKETMDFYGYTDPYKKAMEYIFYQFALYCNLDSQLYKNLGGDLLILMNLLDAGDDYYDDILNQRFNPLNTIQEKNVQNIFNQLFLERLDKMVKNILKLDNPYEVILINILGEYLNKEKERILSKLNNKGKNNDDQSKLLRYFRSF